MAKIAVDIDTEKLASRLAGITPEVGVEVRKAINAGALSVQREARKLIKNISPGKIETRYKPKRDQVVSRPGDPPNTDRGNLRKGIIATTTSGLLTKSYVATVASTEKYSAALEFGVPGHMQKRPFMVPAFKNRIGSIRKKIKKALSTGVAK